MLRSLPAKLSHCIGNAPKRKEIRLSPEHDDLVEIRFGDEVAGCSPFGLFGAKGLESFGCVAHDSISFNSLRSIHVSWPFGYVSHGGISMFTRLPLIFRSLTRNVSTDDPDDECMTPTHELFFLYS
jgi:hypothetical protein